MNINDKGNTYMYMDQWCEYNNNVCELSNIMSLMRNNFVYASTTRGS
jgi:hypothetical protein